MTTPFTPSYVLDLIEMEQYYQFPNTSTIVCCLTTTSGYCATGESSCADPDKFDVEQGHQFAYNAALRRLRSLETYRRLADKERKARRDS